MLRYLTTLTVAAALLSPLAVIAQTSPPPPATAPAPVAPAPAPKQTNRVRGRITAVDTAKKTITLTGKQAVVTLSVPDSAKIYKIGDAKGSPTGTFADLTVDTMVTAQTNGDETAPVATAVHIRAPKNAAPPAAP